MSKFSIRAAAATSALGLAAATAGGVVAALPAQASSSTATPIKHVVVIFGENVSFDHYFATYPNAANTPGETVQGTGAPASSFTAAPNTPKGINTLQNANLLKPNNPNSVQPTRLTPAQAVTCDQNHEYTAEQKAYNGGLMDKFVQNTSTDACGKAGDPRYAAPGLTMDYYDGNTVTGLWNYAQHFAMSDNSFSDTFGPSTPGALNLVAGQTHGVTSIDPFTGQQTATPDSYTVKSPDAAGVGTVINDPDPAYDDCSDGSRSKSYALAAMSGKNIGDLLNEKNVSWGWFQGGFTPQGTKKIQGTDYAQCTASHQNIAKVSSTDYNPHHEPFQYYASTANPHHLAPANDAEIGHSGQANHQYDLTSFDKVVNTDNMPAVSFLKAPNYQDGHASYSDPIDEQTFVVNEINAIQKSKNWDSTAIVLAYDDSDGWYDHVATKVLNASNDASEDAAWCRDAAAAGTPILNGYADRCGPGPRQPLLVVSPFAKRNFVDHSVTQQSSILRFVEDNWGLGRLGDGSFDAIAGSLENMFNFNAQPRRDGLILDPANGSVVQAAYCAGNNGQHLGQGGSCS
ncbi:phospholipase C [Sinomonas cellulolyticus]|uniref:Alkaline phosphatase family protein n=1 Tax=Sinomonas cellulolyticus TaxID=2801916 RepID=A0ABS1JYL7_9MICC|nr:MULTISPECIES: alkaline phosphatase family protein [Sinomonas]MBL0704137.1 alkaline phosphatase family protein [Sinomonas cellulolyticus]GHG57278.1 phospholipase C [Sinomonas sp. KCTC 49339]